MARIYEGKMTKKVTVNIKADDMEDVQYFLQTHDFSDIEKATTRFNVDWNEEVNETSEKDYAINISNDKAYILVEKFRKPDGTIVDIGYYGGVMPKYTDVFYYTPDKEAAYRFNDKEAATKKAESLNRADYEFVVECAD